MDLAAKFLFLVLFLVQAEDSFCTHFRGGTFTYKPFNPSDTASTKVTISFRVGWRRSYSSSTDCDQTTISSGQLIGPSGYIECREGCYGTVSNLNFRCTDFSVNEDWTTGTNSFQYTFTVPISLPRYYEVSFRGSDWISLVYSSKASWQLRMYVNLTARNDTGRLNTSPVTTMNPIVRLKWGCNHTITIPVTDADNDEVRCRWASGYDECGEICGDSGLRYARINQRECKISYSATDYTGFYGVAVMIEDYAKPTDTQALSGVPLQFLVYVSQSSANCDERPAFTEESRAKGSCIGIPPNGTYFDRIIVRAGGPSKSIVEIITNSPPGFIKSPVALYAPQEYYINVTWTPASSEIETKIFCFTGLENSGITTDQRCVSLLVGVAPPEIVSFFPTGEILPNTRQWTITFDQEFVRPTRSGHIRIHHSDGTVVFSVDVAITAAVLYPVGRLGRNIQFTTSVTFTEKETYYVTLDPGVAKGVTYCGAESSAIRDSSTWTIKIKDVTAPSLTFVRAPSRSGGDVKITWTANENVTAQCTLQAPTQITAQSCNMSWTGNNLTEGFYSIYVQLTDLGGNTAPPVRHSWFVDRTPPQVTITSKPALLSNKRSFSFTFSCREPCTFECGVAQEGNNPTFSQCNSKSFWATSLQNGRIYVFQVRGTDDVGNQGDPVEYKWKVDLQPPAISSLPTQNVDCTSDLSPSVLGEPSVSDNEGSNVTLTYRDIPGGSCSFQRKWTATDQAGNSATETQVINLSNPTTPIVSSQGNATIACGSFEEQQQDMRDAINVTHPCNRPITITYSDSVSTILCGTTFTRTWTIADDCGMQVSVGQQIRILPLQLPVYPINGEVNVALWEALRWPQYPGSVRYNVYLWRYGDAKPTSPTTWTYYRRYSPYNGYPADTRMLWRIAYVINSGALIPSPIWGFQTRAFPDFKVEKILVPPNAFSGQTFEVSWTVRNIGKVGNILTTWYDAVLIGKSTESRSARYATRVAHREILFQNDGYTAKGTVRLRDNEFGVFYIFVATDWYNTISDIDRSNDILLADSPVQVSLTPPPNLKVEKIVVPNPSFSGKIITITWTVKNYGMGVTAHGAWYDRVYLSRDNNRDWSDWLLGTFYHTGVLSVDGSYTRKQPVTLPHKIFGNFSILVITDVYNSVYEHNKEDDNLKAQRLIISLSPPPDLVVTSINTAKNYYTGERMKVQFHVSNEGLGEPFYHWWRDRVTIIHITSKRQEVLGITRFSGVFPPSSVYTRTLYYVIPPSWQTGLYNISVQTDYNNDVFEFIYDNNNARTVQVNVTQKLPDLTVTHVNASVTTDTVQAYLRVIFSVKNVGPGETSEAPWFDAVYVSQRMRFSQSNALWLRDVPHRINLNSGAEYTFDTGPVRVSRDIFSQWYIHVFTDAYSSVREEDVNNNIGHFQNVTFPKVIPDLVVVNFTMVSLAETLLSDSEISLKWTVENNGSGSTLSGSWHDTLYLASSPQVEHNSTRLMSALFRRGALTPGQRYHQVSSTRLPSKISGTYYLVLKVNQGGSLVEKDAQTNNLAWTLVKILPAPLPDLTVTTVSFDFEENRRLLKVSWRVTNIGSWMHERYSWVDKVVMSSTKGNIAGADASLVASKVVSAKLDEEQGYELSVAFQIKNNIRGTFYVHVVTNADSSFAEVPGSSNNMGVSNQTLFVPPPPEARLILRIISNPPPQITFSVPFYIAFRVKNVGFVATTKTSWTDALYAYGRSDANRTEVLRMGVKLKEFPHIGALPAQSFYEVTSSITVPRRLNYSAFIYGYADIHDPKASDPNEPNQPGNVTHPTATPPAPPLIIINEGFLPDLQGTLGNRKVQTRGGQPINVTFNVTNRGESSVQGAWYNALYLSQDVLVDPFDARLATVRATQLAVNGTLSLSVGVFIPYDTTDSEYYLLLSVDSKNTIWESDEQNNEATLRITINRTLSSDLAVVSVSSTGGQFVYGQDVTVNWKIRNNGSRRAEGYKCDTVYLSEDDVWQIEDVRVGKPMCSYVIMEPYNGGANQDTPYSVRSKLPLIGVGGYHGLVKTRSNILDLNRKNNIAVGPKNINVTFPRLPLDDCVTVTLRSREETSYIIENVPDVKTLIVTVNSSNGDAVHELFVGHSKPATAYKYDGGSRFALSADQEVVIPETTAGKYYVLMRRSDTSPTVKPSQLCSRIAKFEIIRVFPNQVAPLGNVTLRFEGTLFGPKLEAFLSANETSSVKAEKVYRMSSTEVYATFITTNLVVGTTLHAKLVNLKTREETVLERSLDIKRGEPGRLETHVDFPEVLLVDNSGVITVSYENVGDTDILTPLLSLSASGGQVKLRPVQKGRLYSEAFSTVVFLAQALQGPGGILPPKAYGEVTFDTVQRVDMMGPGDFALRMLVGNEQPHVYINSSYELKPTFLRRELWAPVWDNFLLSVGKSASSFHTRMSAVSTFLSRSGRRVNLMTDLVQFQLGIANGELTGDPLFAQDDLSGQSSEDDPLPLALQRIYSPLLSKRRDKGVFGVGWIAPWWEANVTQFTPEKVTIVHLREEIVFEAKTDRVYVSQDDKEVTVNNTELHFTDISSSTVFVFDAVEKQLKQIQIGEETITIEYSQSRPTTFKHSSGGHITVTYNHNGLVREALLEDKNGEKRRCFYMYDASNLLSVTTGDQSTRYMYNLKGDLTKVTYPTFTSVDYSWNQFGLLSEVAGFNQEGRLTQRANFSYDWNGKVTISRYPQGDTAELLFNENGKMMDVSADGFSDVRYESVQTDEQFTRIIKQGDQVVIKRTFNEKTRILTIVDANNHKTEFLLGKNREILNATDPEGFVYENVYNNNSKLVMFKYPDGMTEDSDYDRTGRLVKFTTRSGKTLKFDYNENGKIVRKDVQGLGSSYFLHDDGGNLIQATNYIGTINIAYDNENKPSVINYPNGQHITYQFNNFQRRIALKESSSGLHLVYMYDRFYRLVQIGRTAQSGSVDILLQLEYNSKGMVSKRILGNGAYSEYSFYSKNTNLLRLVNYFPNGSVASSFEYDYDDSGRIIQINTTTGNWRYKYDAASQLIESQDPQGRVYRYTYDKRKNRVYVSHEPGNKTLYAANEVNQYTTAGSYDISYDDNGNMKERANRDLRNDSVKLNFSPEDILLQAETPNKRCNYIYDALGNLYKKRCGQTEEQFIIDPFGNPGADIIGKISDGNVTYFVHCKELGLVALMDANGHSYYYEFDGLGSVVGLLDARGNRINQYSYDPFGRMLEANEEFPQDFTFIGQWGVMAERELRDIYWMRSRHYDAQLGRFVSIDPLGFSGKSINLYSYAANNPVMLKDPRGRCLPFNVIGGPLGAILNTGTNVAAYLAAQTLNNQEITLGGIVSSAVTGFISPYLKFGKTIYNVASGFGTSFYGSMWQQTIDDGHVDYKKALNDGINGAISSALPRLSPYCDEILNDLYDKTVKNLLVPKILPLVENITDFLITWVRSLDPNDMIGPPGYGDARFISFNTPLNYKIRFENDPNATAPAQHVIILHTLDGDLDIRTFRLIAFGFGNYTRKLANARASIQETIDLVSEKNIYVRVIAGIDVMTREARWEFQSLDPETGEPPEDPRIGFLPPNNGTTGQGFVAFTVRPKKNLPSLSRIDAQASIYFDKNEPIDTPPIFNTIDSTVPSSNLSVLSDVLKIGTLAVDITTQDEGSGVQSIDIFYKKIAKVDGPLQEQTFLPLLSGITAETTFLPLPAGSMYSLVASAVDFVGNRQPLDRNRAISVDFELKKPSCDNNNYCSGHGNCTLLNFCVCDYGFFGVNCSLDFPLRFETPIINVMYSDTVEDLRTLLYLSAFIPDVSNNQYNNNLTLKIVVDDVPQGFTFNRGSRNGSRITLSRESFGDVWFTPKNDFSGLVRLNITAKGSTPRETKVASSQIEIKIEAVADDPSLNVSVPCHHWNSSNKIIPVSLESHVNDLDGSENLTITATGLPTGYRLAERNITQVVNGSNHTTSRVWRGWFLSFNGTLKPFVMSVTATAEENSNGDKANKTIAVNVDFCVTCEAVNNCSGRGNCKRVNTCDCKSGFKGSLDCSTVSCERVNNCSGRGNCTGPNVCTCEIGYKTVGCSQVSCELVNHCSGHGTCSGPNMCSCHSGFKGSNCSEVSCELLNDCSNHGNCTGPNECTCETGYQGGKDCSKVSCELLSHCSEHGNCSAPNVCTCHNGFKGPNCSEVSCESLNNCSNHGACTGPNECTCDQGYQGADCSEVASDEEGGTSKTLTTLSVVGGSVAAFVLLFLLCLLFIYCYRKRRRQAADATSEPQRKGSTRVYGGLQSPFSQWVFEAGSDPSSSCRVDPKASGVPFYSYQNPVYSMVELKAKDPLA